MLHDSASACLLLAICALSWVGCGSSNANQSAVAAPGQVVTEAEAPSAGAPAAPSKRSTRATVPDGYVELQVHTVVPVEDGHAVILVDPERQLAVPIFIGGTEALSIRHRKRRYPRPLTHDLLDSIMHELGGELVKIQINEIRDGTFIGSVFVRRGERVIEIDARPSDAIALAIGSGVPIFVAKRVLDEAGIHRDQVVPQQPQQPPQPQPI